MCGEQFESDKYHPKQKGCNKPECQKQRQRRIAKKWYEEMKTDLVFVNKMRNYSKRYYQLLKQGLM